MTTPKLPTTRQDRQPSRASRSKSPAKKAVSALKAKERQQGKDVNDREKATG